ncbi:tRNA (uridine(54)-C5)-methyltransferase TrmA [Campylobacter suis]|uniref:tRNA/tmRNA (Uracil-C(5))-methyltransferase n=1 Tax=Campylobacter suis TaxID=2790657 RepID=A0ABM8Q2T9_9BACT|nr:tRNA (uridine(54)-C5)-methyltransferase TrmA [Campylobacter suis]CAD7287170.1 tRNA/tmRNA (uracil-C(5))-methyltransferase [Campylobacter suis]
MNCTHFDECGSCVLGGSYEEQKALKIDKISSDFAEFYDGKLEFFASSEKNYRIRAEFGIWHDRYDIYYTMHAKQKGCKIFINECPKVAKPIAKLMPDVLKNLQSNEMLKTRLFGVEFLACTSGVLLTLLYHKKLDENFQNELKVFASKLNITALARSRGQKILSDELSLIDELEIDKKIYKLSLSENAFTQPNKAVNEKMISWARSCVQNSSDLLELYCGHGNFTIPLSSCFTRVLATEISKSSILNATKNCELNDINNVLFLRMSADELMSAFKKEREFNRLKGLDLFSYNFSHILVDPPRAGLEDSVINFIKKYENIIYISCNPQTLKDNLRELSATHEIVKFAIFDQFAHTNHIECGVLLRAKRAF